MTKEELLHKILSCQEFDFKARETIARLLRDGADLNWRDSHGNTPLHIAAANKHLDAVKTILAAKADVNAVNKHGNTPLQCTIFGTSEMHKTLISAGTNVNAQNGDGNTALIAAAEFCRVGLVRTLLEAGADPLLRNANDRNALDRNAAHLNETLHAGEIKEIRDMLEAAIRVAVLRKIKKDGMEGVRVPPIRGRWVVKKPKA